MFIESNINQSYNIICWPSTVNKEGYVQPIAEPVCWNLPSIPEGQVRHHSNTGGQFERERAATTQKEIWDDTSIPSYKVQLRLPRWNGPREDRNHAQ